MAEFSINTVTAHNVTILNVKGRVDSYTAPELENTLTKLLNENGSKIVLNMQDVEYLSSAGLRAMVNALKDAQQSGGNLHLAAISDPTEMILRTVGMLQMFNIFPTNEEALAGF